MWIQFQLQFQFFQCWERKRERNITRLNWNVSDSHTKWLYHFKAIDYITVSNVQNIWIQFCIGKCMSLVYRLFNIFFSLVKFLLANWILLLRSIKIHEMIIWLTGPVQFPSGPTDGPVETSGVIVGASGYGFVPPSSQQSKPWSERKWSQWELMSERLRFSSPPSTKYTLKQRTNICHAHTTYTTQYKWYNKKKWSQFEIYIILFKHTNTNTHRHTNSHIPQIVKFLHMMEAKLAHFF